MKRANLYLFIALLFPIITLMTLTAHKRNIIMTGYEVIFPITGYDPRDLLSGDYIVYSVQYPVSSICEGAQSNQTAYICLDNMTFSFERDPSCQHYLRGVCYYSRFVAGIERFYIPESKAAVLDKQVRDGEASVVVSVSPDGRALVKDLRINGKSSGL